MEVTGPFKHVKHALGVDADEYMENLNEGQVLDTKIKISLAINQGDFEQICTIFINIFIMMTGILSFIWGLASTMKMQHILGWVEKFTG